MLKVALTGSTGMIGSHMKALLTNKKISFLDVNREVWDLSDWKTDSDLDEIFNEVEVIFHFAAVLPTNDDDETRVLFDVNVRSCLNIAQWATKRNVAIVFMSSSSVYKNPHANSIDENSEKVVYGLGGLYGYTKLLAENIFTHFIAQGLKAIILRPTSVYGYGLGENNVIDVFIKKAFSNDTIELFEANNKVNFIHALDVVNAALDAYKKSAWGVFNICAKEMVSFNRLAEVIVFNVRLGKSIVLSESISSFERFDLNCEKAKLSFDFNSKIDIQTGIKMMIHNELLASPSLENEE